MTASGTAFYAGTGDEYDIDDLLGNPALLDAATAEATTVADYIWGAAPPAITQIPLFWLMRPVTFRQDPPINHVDANRSSGVVVRTDGAASQFEFGVWPTQVTLATATDADPGNYGAFVTGNYGIQRMRCPQISIELQHRTLSERRLILAQEIGRRIQLTGVPASWPEGAANLIIEGIGHQAGSASRVVTWNTAPCVGPTIGQVGPWFRANLSFTDVGDKLAF